MRAIRGRIHRLITRLVAVLRANPVAWAALFIALSAGAVAATSVPRNSVKSKSIKDGQVHHQDIGKDAVDSDNIHPDAVKGPQIASGAVGSAQIADGAVGAGDLDPAAQADRDLDLLKGERITVSDPDDGAIATSATILTYGPFTFKATCQDNGGTETMGFFLVSTEAGHVNTSSISPDDFNAGESQPLAGGTTVNANSTTSSGGYALTASGRFISLGIIAIAEPTGSGADCVFHSSGWGG